MKIKSNFYVVIDDSNMIWEKSIDKDSNDYFDRDPKEISKKNILSHKQAKKLKSEIDKNVSTYNNINFYIKRIDIGI